MAKKTNFGLAGLCAALLAQSVVPAHAHPHVFVEANLEIVRNEKGEATSLRHVWRFDELFSSSLILDFDENRNSKLDPEELEEIAKVTSESISEYSYYTEIRNGDGVVNFYEPDPYIADNQDGQLLIVMAMELEKPVAMGEQGFRVAVSDPTYYVAIDFLTDDAVMVSGNGQGCRSNVVPPDWDELYATNPQKLADLFAAPADQEIQGSDDYLTWVHFSCK